MRALASLLVALVVSVTAPVHAAATTPGTNGRIAFESGRTDELDLFSMTPDGGDMRRLTTSSRVEQGPDWSPDGSRIAYYVRSGGGDPYGAAGDIWVMNDDGTAKVRLTSGSDDDEDPAWSPTGDWIAFSRTTTTTRADIYVVRDDGTGLHRLTSNAAPDVAPAWSSTNRVLFTSFRTGHGDLYAVDPNGKHLKRVTTTKFPDLFGDWSPSGDRIAFFEERASGTGGRDLFVIHSDGTHLKRLTSNGADDSYPSWSPDGKFVAFQSNKTKNGFYDVWTLKLAGGVRHRVTHDGFVDGGPDWQAA